MLHGCQKKIIHLRSTGSEMFDEAFFIVRENPAQKSGSPAERDMVREAQRILLSARTAGEREAAERRRRLTAGLICFLSGAVLSMLIFLLCI